MNIEQLQMAAVRLVGQRCGQHGAMQWTDTWLTHLKADSSPCTSLDTISRNSDWWARP